MIQDHKLVFEKIFNISVACILYANEILEKNLNSTEINLQLIVNCIYLIILRMWIKIIFKL